MESPTSWANLCTIVNGTVEQFVGCTVTEQKIWQINDTVMRATQSHMPFVGDDGVTVVAFDVRRYGTTTLEVVPIFKGDLH